MLDQAHQKRSVSADWILNRIQEGKNVRLKNAVIKGDLYVSKLDLPTKHVDRTEYQLKNQRLSLESKTISSKIEITNSKLDGTVNFSNCIFEDDASFSGSTFNREAKFEGVTFNREARFEGVTFNREARFKGASFSESARFEQTIFRGDTWFRGTSFSGGGAGFGGASFSRSVWFDEASFTRDAQFEEASFSGYAGFERTIFRWNTLFNGASFSGGAGFKGASFSRFAIFKGTSFSWNAWFIEASFNEDAWFDEASFEEDAWFNGASFYGEILAFRDAYFTKPASQEYACRRAKNVLEKNGDREEAGYHFYREMEAKRVQKGIRGNSGLSLIDCLKTDTWSFWKFFWYDAIEWLFAQVMFGYGVHFERLIASWAVIVALFASLYYSGDAISGVSSVFDYLKVSFATAIAPGYIAVIMNPSNSTGGYRLTSGYYQAAAMVETLLGTFLWAGFIATFAKKYMR